MSRGRTYGAGKTFVLNFRLALREEYRGRGPRVLAVCPGPTRTSFFDTVGESAAIGGRMMPADAVDRGWAYVVPGVGNSMKRPPHPTPPP